MQPSRHRSCRRRGGFQPPHCPNPDCRFHKPHPDWHFVRDGFYLRPSDQRRSQAFQCRHCGRKFSVATFSPTYWLKRPSLLRPIAQLLNEGPALRQIARLLRTSHTTVAHHAARLGRHCLLFLQRLRQDTPLDEPLVVDGFQSFVYSQYFPFHLNLAVGADSWFIYHFTDSPLRRSGSMTPAQRRRREQLERTLGRPDPRAVEHGMQALLEDLLPAVAGACLVLHSDDHPAYRRALRRLARNWGARRRIDHRVTPSTARRTARNPLFPVNLTDLLLRHSSANHRRETIAFSRQLQRVLERAATLVVWRNYLKRRVEDGPRESAAMRAGITDRLWNWREVLRRRLFPGQVTLPPRWQVYYRGEVPSAVYGDRQQVHRLTYAY